SAHTCPLPPPGVGVSRCAQSSLAHRHGGKIEATCSSRDPDPRRARRLRRRGISSADPSLDSHLPATLRSRRASRGAGAQPAPGRRRRVAYRPRSLASRRSMSSDPAPTPLRSRRSSGSADASGESAVEQRHSRRRPGIDNAGLVGLAVLSLALRLLFWSGTDIQETLRADASHYTYLAWSLANRGVSEDTRDPCFAAPLRWPPGFPVLLAPFFRARSQVEGAAVAQAAQVVVGAALPVLVVVLGRHFLSGSL